MRVRVKSRFDGFKTNVGFIYPVIQEHKGHYLIKESVYCDGKWVRKIYFEVVND